MEDSVYTISWDGDGMNYIEGPAPGGQCSFHGGLLYPNSRFANEKDAKKTAFMMNMAFQEGYDRAQADIRNSLGIKK